MICNAEDGRSSQFRPITCEIATSDPHGLNPRCQGVGQAFDFDQSQVKSHEGLTCVSVWIQLGLFRTCFLQGVHSRVRGFPVSFVLQTSALSWRNNSWTFWIVSCSTGRWKSLQNDSPSRSTNDGLCSPSRLAKVSKSKSLLVVCKIRPTLVTNRPTLVTKPAWTITITRSEYWNERTITVTRSEY